MDHVHVNSQWAHKRKKTLVLDRLVATNCFSLRDILVQSAIQTFRQIESTNALLVMDPTRSVNINVKRHRQLMKGFSSEI